MESPPLSQPAKKPNWLLWIGLGCLGVLLLLGSCIAFGVMAWSRGSTEIESIAKRDVKAICKTWSADAVMDRFDAAAKGDQSHEDVEAWLAAFSKSLGPIVRVRSSRMLSVYSGTGGSRRMVRCEAEFEKAVAYVTIVYVSEGDDWMIRNLRFESPALEHLDRPPVEQ
jgi:hypothetical protein